MSIVASIKYFFYAYLHIFSWRDCLEILLLAGIIYLFVRWLAQDTQKNLTAWFYGYCGLVFGAYYCGLTTLYLMFCIATPVVILFFMVMHQHILQKNFITLTSLSPRAQPASHWLEALVQGCLHALNKNREIFCIIERTDALDLFLSTNAVFNADITQELLEILTKHDGSLTLWVNHAGKLHALNPVWRGTADEIWVSNDVKALHTWKQNALLMTSKSNAIMFTISPTTRLCTIIMEGKMINDLSAHHAFALLKNYCTFSKQGDFNGDIDSRNRFKQSTPQK